jgi:ubiquinone/menaquinone biosynthesis C-methylase UbiE
MDHPGDAAVTTTATAPAQPSFGAVDDHPDAESLIAALDVQASLQAIRRLRASAVRLLAPRSGHRLIDVGCGTGDVTRLLAARVGPSGKVTGIDTSATMLAEARRRTAEHPLPIELRHGDITHLAAGDGEFDGVYSERVFQHLAAPDAAMAELVRITRPGGRIVVIDTDWGMHAIHGGDPAITSRVTTCWAEHAANGWAGRQLPALFARAGLTDPVIATDTITSRDPRPPSLEPFATMAAVAEHRGVLTGDEALTWLTQLTDAGTDGTFFWAVTLISVGATRP